MSTKFRIKESILENVATLSLESKKVKVTYDKVIAESGRIERIAENFYINSKETDYNIFILNWLNDNLNKLLYTDELSYDVVVPDEAYENELDKYI
jgi:hypothetical protein